MTSARQRFEVSEFSRYQADPVGFGGHILGESYTTEVKHMMRSVRDNEITLVKSANAVGKTHGAARVAVWWYKCFPGQVWTAAAPPEGNLKRLLWGEINGFVEKHPKVFESDTKTGLSIARSAKEFLTGVTIPTTGTESQREAKFSGKHAPYLLFILDEADAIPPEVFSGIESCMSGGQARLLCIFNPRAEAGDAYRMERDKRGKVIQLSALTHPNVVTGENRIPGAVTREATIRRINEWTRPLVAGEEPNAECFELPDFLEGQTAPNQAGDIYPPLAPGWYRIMEAAFSYMVLDEYPAKGSQQLISKEWILAARERWNRYVSVHGERPQDYAIGIMGFDIGELGNDSNAACFRYGGFVEKLVTWGGIDTVATGDRAIIEYKARNIGRANVDATGVGAGVAPHMQRGGCSASPVKVASKPTQTTELGEFQILRDQLWWSTREWLRTDPGAMLPPDEMLIEELTVPTYEVVNGKLRVMKKETMRELLKRSPDRADALTLTFYAGGLWDGCDFT